MLKVISSLLLGIIAVSLTAQSVDSITIVRDKWGVPHIYAKTDAQVAYGLAWATAEDDFESMQANLLAIKSSLGEVKGKDGAIFDFFAFAIETKKYVHDNYETAVSPEFKKVLEGYTAGANAYAAQHPEEVLKAGVFPIQPQDILEGYVLNLTLLSSVQEDIIKILNRNINRYELPQGSNGLVMNKNITADGNTYLAVNSHQPLEGPFAWYEAHVESEEGWKMIGANFAGGVTLFVGTTPNLGWTHTVNHPDFSDVYKLEMHPSNKLQYKFDEKWETLEPRIFKTKVKVGFLKLPYKQKIYRSKYGLTFKNKDGFYAIRFQANMTTIKAAEQWYWMNKAQNYTEFRKALDWQGIGTTNIVYADKGGNIFYIGNANMPYRNPKYNWRKVLPGNTSETLWENGFYPIDSLPQLLNPKSGYLFNSNNTPFNATAPKENLDSTAYPKAMGYMTWDNNRSLQFQRLIGAYDKISYEDFKKIKYNNSWAATPSTSFRMTNIEDLFQLDAEKYPKIAPAIKLLQEWDRTTNMESMGASIFTLSMGKVWLRLDSEGRNNEMNTIKEEEWVDAVTFAQAHLIKHFGTINVMLGQLQRHKRGDVDLPMSGGMDVIAAMYGSLQPDGTLKTVAGDSYIQLVQYTPEGVVIESVNAYGASARPDSPHYTDQMPLFTKNKLKSMTFDKAKIIAEAEKIYKLGYK